MNDELKEALRKAIADPKYPDYIKENMKGLLEELEDDEEISNDKTN